MIDQTRYRAWRSGPDAELHVIEEKAGTPHTWRRSGRSHNHAIERGLRFITR
jgi:hypothetical protein